MTRYYIDNCGDENNHLAKAFRWLIHTSKKYNCNKAYIVLPAYNTLDGNVLQDFFTKVFSAMAYKKIKKDRMIKVEGLELNFIKISDIHKGSGSVVMGLYNEDKKDLDKLSSMLSIKECLVLPWNSKPAPEFHIDDSVHKLFAKYGFEQIKL